MGARPVDGAANEELIAFLAAQLGVPKSDVRLARGGASETSASRCWGWASRKYGLAFCDDEGLCFYMPQLGRGDVVRLPFTEQVETLAHVLGRALRVGAGAPRVGARIHLDAEG